MTFHIRPASSITYNARLISSAQYKAKIFSKVQDNILWYNMRLWLLTQNNVPLSSKISILYKGSSTPKCLEIES